MSTIPFALPQTQQPIPDATTNSEAIWFWGLIGIAFVLLIILVAIYYLKRPTYTVEPSRINNPISLSSILRIEN